jgi:hypothetical protein
VPITVNHAFTSPIADGTNTQIVRPSNWNSAHLVTYSATGSEIVGAFSNANGISFGLSGGLVTASYTVPSAGLTTAAQSDHSHGAVAFSGTNVSASFTSQSNGLSMQFSAGAGGAGDGVNIIAAGGSTAATTGTIVFSNSNGVSFGLNGATVTASHNGYTGNTTQFITTARASNDAIGLNTALTAGPLAATINSSGFSLNAGSVAGTTSGFAGGSISGSITHNTAGINISLSHPAWITTAAAQTQQPMYFSASGTSTSSNTLQFGNSNGVSFSLSNGSVVGTVATTYAGSNHTHGNPTLNLTNINGTTASASNGLTLSLSAVVPAQTNQSIGVYAAGNTQNSSSTTIDARTFSIYGSGAATVGVTNGSIVINAPNAAAGNVTFSAGTTNNGLPNVSFGNANGVSFGLNGSTITASVNAGGGATLSGYSPPWAASGMATNSSLGQSTLYFMPFDLPQNLYASRINFYVSLSGALSAGNSTGSCTARLGYALYTLNSDSLNRLTSYEAIVVSQTMNSNTQYVANHYYGLSDVTSHSTLQTSISATNATTYQATNINGLRVIALPVNSTMTPGRYWLGMSVQTNAGNAMTNNISVAVTSVGVQPEVRYLGSASAATNASVFRMMQGMGFYSAQSAAWPSTIAYTTDNIRAAAAQTLVHFQLVGRSFTNTYL